METKEKTEAGGKVAEKEEEQVVTPWEVSAKDGGKIDYDKLIDLFGCQRLDQSLIQRVQRLTACPPHVFLRRGVFLAWKKKRMEYCREGTKNYIGNSEDVIQRRNASTIRKKRLMAWFYTHGL